MSISQSSLPISFIWLMAFICALFPIGGFQLEFFAISIGCLFLWAGLQFAQKAPYGWDIPKSSILFFAGCFWLLACFSIFWSPVPPVSLMGFCFFSALPLTFFTLVLHPDKQAFYFLAKIMAGLFAILSIWAMVQIFVFPHEFDGRAHHPLANANSLGALFNLALFPALGWMLIAKNKHQANLALLLSILIAGGLMATGSRGAFVTMFLTLLVFGFLLRGHVRQHLKCLGIFIIATTLLFFLTQFNPFAHETMMTRVTSLADGSIEDLSNNRWNIWAGAWGIIRDHWLMGTGIATFFLYYPEYRVPADHIGAWLAHSDPLQFFAEMGITSVFFFYAFLGAALLRTRAVLKKIEALSDQRVLIIAPLCALGAIVLHSHITFNFYNLSILLGTGLILGFWFLETKKIIADPSKQVGFESKTPPFLGQVASLLPFVMVIFLFGSYVLSEYFVNKAKAEIFEGKIETFAVNLQRAHEVGHGSNYRGYLLAINVPMAILETQGNTLPRSEKKKMFQQINQHIEAVLALNPRSPSAYFYRGKVQELVEADIIPPGTLSREAAYQKALQLDQLHLGARMALANLYKEQGDEEKAYDVLRKGLMWTYSNDLVMQYYGQVLIEATLQKDQETSNITKRKIKTYNNRVNQALEKERKNVFGDHGIFARD